MRFLLILIVIISIASSALAFRFQFESEEKLYYVFDLLPSANLKSLSSAVTLGYPVRERTSIEIAYISLDNPILLSSSYIVSYRLALGLEKWHMILPTAIFGYQFIYTPETGFTTPIDFGLLSEIELAENLNFIMPINVSLFSNSNLVDFSIAIERKEAWLGDFMVGVRNLKPITGSNFSERLLLILGFINQF